MPTLRLHRFAPALLVTALLIAPALAGSADVARGADHLVGVVRGERLTLEGVGGRDVRPAIRLLRRAERSLIRLDRAFDADPALDARKMRLVARVGAAVLGAEATGRLPPTTTVVPAFSASLLRACEDEVESLARDAAVELDRIVLEHFRAKVVRRFDRARALLDDALSRDRADARAAGLARALPHVSAALAKARLLCQRETAPRCPRGIRVANTELAYGGRGALTVYDVSWDLEVRLASGAFHAHRTGELSDISFALQTPLPWSLTRGDRIDVLDTGAIERGFRVDGTLTWRTSVGELVVPVHLDR